MVADSKKFTVVWHYVSMTEIVMLGYYSKRKLEMRPSE